MEYRYLGNTGLQVSFISFGNMVNINPQDDELNTAIVKKAFEAGVNFFDTAEMYGFGQAEESLGRILKTLQIPRSQIVVSTKLISRHGAPGGNPVNRTVTLSRKHVIEGTDTALKRLQLDYVDLIFAHRFDQQTPVEEIVRGFNQVIEDGKAFYWATSEWTPTQIQEAINVADRLGLHRPIADQCQYNMLERKNLEVDLAPLFDHQKYGTTIWGPVAGGLLTGKYNDQIPEDSRYNTGLPFLPKEILQGRFARQLSNPATVNALKGLAEVAKELGVPQSALAVAWTLRNKDVSTAIIGARTVQQLEETLEAVKVYKQLTPELDARLETILGNRPVQSMNWRKWAPNPDRR